MKVLTETFISFVDLIEAEGRLLKRKILQIVSSIGLMVVALLFVILAFGFLLAAIYQFLLLYWPLPLVLFAMSLLCLAITGGLLWVMQRINHQP
jgi:hypothetical protein